MAHNAVQYAVQGTEGVDRVCPGSFLTDRPALVSRLEVVHNDAC